MSDRIDTDAIRRRKTALSRAQIVALCDEVEALRSREVPDGHVRIDGKVWRVERSAGRMGQPSSIRLVPSPPPGEPESEKP